MALSRRSFCGGLLSLAALRGTALENPDAPVLPKWRPGEFQIHFIHTGAGESQFLIFPDGTSMLLDCPGAPSFKYGRNSVPLLPNGWKHAGEWIARYVMRTNPHGKHVDYMALSHFHDDHGGSAGYHAGVKTTAEGDYYLSGFALAAEQLTFGKAIDRKGMGTDPWLRRPVDPLKTMHNMDVLCRHLAARDGLVRESFRLGATDQVVPLHGDCPRFEVFNFCANGQAADGKGGVVDLFEGHFDETPQTPGFENPLSTGYVFTYGDFKFGTFGDLNHVRVTPEWTVNVERIAARHVPKVSLAKFNHHANRRSHPVSWLRALSAKAWVSCNWLEQQADAEIFLKLAETGLLGKGNVYPTVFPLARMEKARTERAAWLDAVAPATCNGAHIVVTVPPDGKTFTVACVDAGDEKMRVLSETKYET